MFAFIVSVVVNIVLYPAVVLHLGSVPAFSYSLVQGYVMAGWLGGW